jgi:hypothetical protein
MFWKDAEYSITEFSGGTSISVDSNTYGTSDIVASLPTDIPICYKRIPIFMIKVVAKLDVDDSERFKLKTHMDCFLLSDGAPVD